MGHTSETRQLLAHDLFTPSEVMAMARLRRAIKRGERNEQFTKEQTRQLMFLRFRYQHGEFAVEGN